MSGPGPAATTSPLGAPCSRAPLLLALLGLAPACGFPEQAVPFKAVDHYLAVKDGSGYRPIFVKGVNLGVGLPGTEPGELAPGKEDYLRWFRRMSDIGVNVVRVYTLHHPRFFEAVYEHNIFRPDAPLYVVQGIWLDEESPTGEVDVYGFTDDIDEAIEEVVDCVHGNRVIEHRLGRAYGEYTVDISRWVMAWIVGREIYGAEVIGANRAHPEQQAFDGSALRLARGSPAEVWAVARLDRLIGYERDRYGVQRPVAFSSWPTLDPLHHVTERHSSPDRLDRLDSVFDAGEDDAEIDLAGVDQRHAPAGVFASYHAYPYYPDFIYREPRYLRVADHEGLNPYFGYLLELKRHYGKMPLMISEFGIPSSWGNAHLTPHGMDHGGHEEEDQAQIIARLQRNIYEAGSAGGMLFAWIDEWWKRTWIVADVTFPRARLPMVYDVTSPEENYGLIAFDLPPPLFAAAAAASVGRIRRVRWAADPQFFHLRIQLVTPLEDGEVLTVGYDTYSDELGESVLPDGTRTRQRSELALVIAAPDEAQLHVTHAYDVFAIGKSWCRPDDLCLRPCTADPQPCPGGLPCSDFWCLGPRELFPAYRSTRSDGAPWVHVRWLTQMPAHSDDETYVYPPKIYPVGRFKHRQAGDPPQQHWAVDMVSDRTVVWVRVPWALLNFSDASQLKVLHDDRTTAAWEHPDALNPSRETADSDGIRVAVVLGDDVVETERLRWEPWDRDTLPPTREREKPAMAVFREAISRLPDVPPRW